MRCRSRRPTSPPVASESDDWDFDDADIAATLENSTPAPPPPPLPTTTTDTTQKLVAIQAAHEAEAAAGPAREPESNPEAVEPEAIVREILLRFYERNVPEFANEEKVAKVGSTGAAQIAHLGPVV